MLAVTLVITTRYNKSEDSFIRKIEISSKELVNRTKSFIIFCILR